MSNPIITINVTTHQAQSVQGTDSGVVMIPFSAEAVGDYFCGKTITDGIDTQYTAKGSLTLSARYMLEGTDSNGKKCRLFIENNGISLDSCKPKIITDSEALSFLENAELYANGEPTDNGVIIRIHMAEAQCGN